MKNSLDAWRKTRFIADLMLGKLARYLRILGYDTLYPFYLNDNEIIRIVLNEHRVLLTRDKALYKTAISRGLQTVLVQRDDIVGQLNQLYCRGLIRLSLDLERTRCPRCNHPLKKTTAPPLKVHAGTSPRVYFICENCGSIYWIGAHWRSIKKTLGEALELGCG